MLLASSIEPITKVIGWIIDHMIDVSKSEELELVELSTANTKHGASIEPNTLHQQDACFHDTTTSIVPSREMKAISSTDGGNHQLQNQDGSQDGNGFSMSQSPAQL